MQYFFISIILNLLLMRVTFFLFLKEIGFAGVFTKVTKERRFLTVSATQKLYGKTNKMSESELKWFKFYKAWEVFSFLLIPLFPVILIMNELN